MTHFLGFFYILFSRIDIFLTLGVFIYWLVIFILKYEGIALEQLFWGSYASLVDIQSSPNVCNIARLLGKGHSFSMFCFAFFLIKDTSLISEFNISHTDANVTWALLLQQNLCFPG